MEGSRVGVPDRHVCERSVADQPGLVREIFPAFCLHRLHLLTVIDTLPPSLSLPVPVVPI